VSNLDPEAITLAPNVVQAVDHYGPDDVSIGPGMQVPPHPHIGLQTASWLFEGLVLHRDSLGSRQMIRPGELNLMTAGRGIAHSEESAAGSGRSAAIPVSRWRRRRCPPSPCALVEDS
jgi:quercetin 2,3-dioxygenase